MKIFTDIYKLPLNNIWGRVFDMNKNFVFQFLEPNDYIQEFILDVINGEKTFTNNQLSFKHDGGYIMANENETSKNIILIRGWGNLTGIGGHHLSAEDAANIQDTFADFIVNQLNKRV